MSGFDLFRGDALDAYRDWPAPATIISDGAYGVRGFHGDTVGPEDLPRWYRPHIAAWAAATGPDGPIPPKQWVRHEWARSGLALQRANEACGVRNAATRKYLTKDWLWYWPPGEMTERLAAYANSHGRPSGWPYYSLDGERPVTGKEWDALRYRWRHAHGLTNVWSRRPLHDTERLKGTLRRAAPRVYNPTAGSSAHLNQKPLEFMERLIEAVTEPGDVIWEPFGGLCSASVAAVALGRRAYAAETDPAFADLAAQRVAQETYWP